MNVQKINMQKIIITMGKLRKKGIKKEKDKLSLMGSKLAMEIVIA